MVLLHHAALHVDTYDTAHITVPGNIPPCPGTAIRNSSGSIVSPNISCCVCVRFYPGALRPDVQPCNSADIVQSCIPEVIGQLTVKDTAGVKTYNTAQTDETVHTSGVRAVINDLILLICTDNPARHGHPFVRFQLFGSQIHSLIYKISLQRNACRHFVVRRGRFRDISLIFTIFQY